MTVDPPQNNLPPPEVKINAQLTSQDGDDDEEKMINELKEDQAPPNKNLNNNHFTINAEVDSFEPTNLIFAETEVAPENHMRAETVWPFLREWVL